MSRARREPPAAGSAHPMPEPGGAVERARASRGNSDSARSGAKPGAEVRPPSEVPSSRILRLNQAALRPEAGYVLYWMIAARRARWNYALDRALELARALDRPLIVLEALRADYPWASERMHRFVLDGMADNARAFEGTGVLYHPYVEPRVGAGQGLLEALAAEACAIVTDDSPGFFLDRMTRAVAGRVGVSLEAIDSNGILPLRSSERSFSRAFDFRRYVQAEARPYLTSAPRRDPLRAKPRPRTRLPAGIATRWPRASEALLAAAPGALEALPIDHTVRPAPLEGGSAAAVRALKVFLAHPFALYAEDRGDPVHDRSSGLSPYLHFGHISAHEVLDAIMRRESWSLDKLAKSKSGQREGWWGTSAAAESFLDQLITWRELGFRFCSQRNDYDRFESLPDWAQRTLDEHASDPRPHLYSLQDFEQARTHDSLWNAAQRQLLHEGRIHNYLRMLWGKKILHWSESPRAALEIMIELNNKYALDGRDPNSYSGIFWVLGRFDRAWGPERDVFGKIRYMSSANTRRKIRVDPYIERWT